MQLRFLLLMCSLPLVVACTPNQPQPESQQAEPVTETPEDVASVNDQDSTGDAVEQDVMQPAGEEAVVLPEDYESERMQRMRTHFALDSHYLSDEARAVLRQHADFLESYPGVQAEVRGFCDERGSNEYNLALGERRALSAIEFLAASGVDANRLIPVSYGELEPVSDCHAERCWKQNRRVEIHYVY